MNKSIFSLNSSLTKSLRGRCAQLNLNKELFKSNPDAAYTDISRKYDQFIKMNGLTKLPIYQYPKQANRLTEVFNLIFVFSLFVNFYSLKLIIYF